MQRIDIDEANASLSDLLDAAVRGKEIILTRDAKPIARLVALVHQHPRPRFGSARGLVHIAPDFDAPLTDFNEYMQ